MSSHAALVVPALAKHTATVICLHGLGDSGSGLIWLAENWRMRNKFPEVKFVFPSAPAIRITVNSGICMPAWYDITDFTDLATRSEDEAGIMRSRKTVHELLDAEAKEVPSHRIVVGGFSQGSALGMLSGVSYREKLAGVFGLSGYMLLPGKFKELSDGCPNKDTKIFIGHGADDPLVKCEWGSMTADKLKEWGWDVDFKTYPGLQHSAAPEEIDDLEAYLNGVIPPLGGDKTPEQSK